MTADVNDIIATGSGYITWKRWTPQLVPMLKMGLAPVVSNDSDSGTCWWLYQ